MSQFDAWLRDLAAAGKGGQRFTQLGIDRGRAWKVVLAIAADYSADTFACNLSLSPDGATTVSPTVSVGAYVGGVTEVTLSLTAGQTGNPAEIPADGDGDGVEEVCFELLRTPAGEADPARLMAGIIPISGKV